MIESLGLSHIMSIPSGSNQIVQTVSFKILNDNNFENRFSRDGRRWANAMRTIRKQSGWLQTMWGRDVNALNRLDLFIGAHHRKVRYPSKRPILTSTSTNIVWAELQQAQKFQSSPSFEATLSEIAISSLSINCIELQGTLFPGGPTSLITLFFSPLISHADRLLFEQQVQCFAEEVDHGTSLSLSSGWIVGNVQRDSRMLRGYIVALAWESLDEMYDVKKDHESLFNNLFVPLRDEASVGSETALYTALKDAEVERSKCVVM